MVLQVALLLHQVPRDIWFDTSLDECIDLIALHNKQNGAPQAPGSNVEPLHDFDREQIAALKAERKD